MVDSPIRSTLSLRIDRQQTDPKQPSQLAALVRRILAENASKVERAITAGALTVEIPAEEHAIEIQDGDSGRIHFAIGGRAWMTETVPFVIDWKGRTLKIQLPEAEKPSAAPAKKLRIIYAEESPPQQEMLSEWLSGRGHSVTCCDDGRAALRNMAEAGTYDVLITDDRLPRMDGLELIAALRDTRSLPKIIVTFAFLNPDREAQYRRLGVRLFLPKPSPYERVLSAVEDD
ncbi:MAG: hypothetical protein BGO12_20060 [Verrucomicrobia bacterium 61-8]|nr:MAG: hypothetical protein BGO12_20060 [Verrucomicrobia bacterium 61-8]